MTKQTKPNKPTLPQKFLHLPKPLLFIILVIVFGVVTFGAVLYRNYAEDVKLSEYNQKVRECGRKDLVVARGNIHWGGYSTPGSSSYKVPASSAIQYFCTEQEAIDAGFEKDE